MTIDYSEDSNAPVDLTAVRKLAQEQLSLESEVLQAENKLKEVKLKLFRVQERELPLLMKTLQLTTFTLESGFRVEIKEGISMSVSAERKPAVCDYLEENGAGDLISLSLTAEFGRGKEEELATAIKALESLGVFATSERDINTARLKAWAKEKLEKAEEIDLILLGGIQWEKAIIADPKSKKKSKT